MYVLVMRGERPTKVNLIKTTPAGNIKVEGFSKVLRKGHHYEVGDCWKTGDAMACKDEGDNFKVLTETYERLESIRQRKKQEREDRAKQIEQRDADRLEFVKTNFKAEFDAIWSQRKEYKAEGRRGENEYVILFGTVPPNTGMKQAFSFVTIRAEKEPDDTRWQAGYSLFSNRTSGTSSFCSDKDLQNCLWLVLVEAYYSGY